MSIRGRGALATLACGSVVVVGALAVVLVAPAVAEASVLGCGTTVTSDVTMTHDLVCQGTALRVQFPVPGSTVHVFMAGHRITGDGSGLGVEISPSGATSPYVLGSLVVQGGTISGFDAAVGGAPNPSGSPRPSSVLQQLDLNRMSIVDNTRWISPIVFRNLNVTRSTVVDSGTGMGMTDSDGVTTVRRSTFVRSSVGGGFQSFNFVYDSVFVGGGFDAGGQSNIVAERNSFSFCDVGITEGDNFPGGQTTIRNNVFYRCSTGLVLRGLVGPVARSVIVRGNVFAANSGTGLSFALLTSTPGDTVISANVAVGNGGDGIAGTDLVGTSGGVGVRLSDNLAVRNAGHGIDITYVGGVQDGGGNIARGNATHPQCVGVVCSGH